jgi:hypothetical protein
MSPAVSAIVSKKNLIHRVKATEQYSASLLVIAMTSLLFVFFRPVFFVLRFFDMTLSSQSARVPAPGPNRHTRVNSFAALDCFWRELRGDSRYTGAACGLSNRYGQFRADEGR